MIIKFDTQTALDEELVDLELTREANNGVTIDKIIEDQQEVGLTITLTREEIVKLYNTSFHG